MISWINSIFKTILYKAYVIALLFFVVWAGKFIYPLIYWEFQHVGVIRNIEINKSDDAMTRLQKIRYHLDNRVQTRSYDLGDTKFKEHFEKGHFHHVGQTVNDPALNGCDYCHTIFPHIKNKEARAFRNMHGYFLACETCHYRIDSDPATTTHNWVDTQSGRTIKRPTIVQRDPMILPKAKGNYGARIAPWIMQAGKPISVIEVSNKKEAVELLESFPAMSRGDVNKSLVRMHKKISTKPLECDACHSTKQKIMAYANLGYSQKESRRLVDAEIVSVISKYKDFYFPGLFQDKER